MCERETERDRDRTEIRDGAHTRKKKIYDIAHSDRKQQENIVQLNRVATHLLNNVT